MSETQEPKQDSEEKSPETESQSKPESKPEKDTSISFQDFMQTDLRVAQIIEAEKIEKSEKLVKLQIDVGEELGKRQIVAGIAKHYSAEELVGKKIAIVANLKPAKLMGEVSQGMLLASSDDQGNLNLVDPGGAMPAGSKIG